MSIQRSNNEEIVWGQKTRKRHGSSSILFLSRVPDHFPLHPCITHISKLPRPLLLLLRLMETVFTRRRRRRKKETQQQRQPKSKRSCRLWRRLSIINAHMATIKRVGLHCCCYTWTPCSSVGATMHAYYASECQSQGLLCWLLLSLRSSARSKKTITTTENAGDMKTDCCLWMP